MINFSNKKGGGNAAFLLLFISFLSLALHRLHHLVQLLVRWLLAHLQHHRPQHVSRNWRIVPQVVFHVAPCPKETNGNPNQ